MWSFSVFVWRRYDMQCTSGFVDFVIFAHKPNGQAYIGDAKEGVFSLTPRR